MKNKKRLWKIAVLMAVVLVSFAGVITYKVIAGTSKSSATCPPSPDCPSSINCPVKADVDVDKTEGSKSCPLKGASDREACKLLSDDGSKKICSHKGHCGKKAGCDLTAKQGGL